MQSPRYWSQVTCHSSLPFASVSFFPRMASTKTNTASSSENPILNNPYEEPLFHYATSLEGELDYSKIEKARRIFAGSVQTIPLPQKPQQGELITMQEFAETSYGAHLVNLLRKEVG